MGKLKHVCKKDMKKLNKQKAENYCLKVECPFLEEFRVNIKRAKRRGMGSFIKNL